METIGKIYAINSIQECDKFTLYSFNRGIREDVVKNYEKKYLAGADMGCMTIEKGTNGILDGQHRREAWKRAKAKNPNIKPLIFKYDTEIMHNDEERKQRIHNLNLGMHWNLQDFITSNMEGDNDLARLEAFCLAHPRLHKVGKSGKNKGKKTALYRRGAAVVIGDPKYYRNALRGDFKASDEQWAEAEDVYNEVENFLVAMQLSNQTDIPALEGIINGWQAVRNDRRYYNKISKLPEGVNTLYKYVGEFMDLRHTTSKEEWANRFGTLVDSAFKDAA